MQPYAFSVDITSGGSDTIAVLGPVPFGAVVSEIVISAVCFTVDGNGSDFFLIDVRLCDLPPADDAEFENGELVLRDIPWPTDYEFPAMAAVLRPAYERRLPCWIPVGPDQPKRYVAVRAKATLDAFASLLGIVSLNFGFRQKGVVT